MFCVHYVPGFLKSVLWKIEVDTAPAFGVLRLVFKVKRRKFSPLSLSKIVQDEQNDQTQESWPNWLYRDSSFDLSIHLVALSDLSWLSNAKIRRKHQTVKLCTVTSFPNSSPHTCCEWFSRTFARACAWVCAGVCFLSFHSNIRKIFFTFSVIVPT